MPDGYSEEPILDFPTAWAIQSEVGQKLPHHKMCSAPATGGAFLCDCGAVEREWESRRYPQANHAEAGQ